jgi:hypothetical protein
MPRSATRRSPAPFVAVSTLFILILVACGATAVLQAQTAPAAYVYVTSSPGSNMVIDAYAAASNGKLTPVAGSPFSTNLGYGASLANNGKYLFATNGVRIYSYSIASNAAIKPITSVNAEAFNQSSCGGPEALFLDRAGANLYDLDIYSDCANNGYQFFSIGASTGKTNYLGVTSATSPIFEVPLSFLGNNEYAYGASCYHWYQEIFGFRRSSDGALTDLNIKPAMPSAMAGQFYCPNLAAADGTNHVAVSMQATSSASFQPVGSAQLAVYTANTSGGLTTTSTYANMPKVAVGSVMGISISPSGQLLAVAGMAGLQVFHFNGANPIKPYTGLLTTAPIDQVDQIGWDNNNHLYAISQSAGKLFVFTIIPTGYSQAAGSPYAIKNPGHITVLPK